MHHCSSAKFLTSVQSHKNLVTKSKLKSQRKDLSGCSTYSSFPAKNCQRMDQAFNESYSPNDEDIPVSVTYLNMVVILMVTTVIVTPAVMVVNIIRKTKELHTKYYFFVANLLATIVASIAVQGILQYLIIILYLFDKNCKAAGVALKWSLILLHLILHLVTAALPITLAVERMVVIAFPSHHRGIMMTKTAAGILALLWGLSAILALTVIIIEPINIVWSLGLINWRNLVHALGIIPRLTSAVFAIVANIFLQYKLTLSNRKAAENERLENEEEAEKFKRLVQLFRVLSKTTNTIFLIACIDVVANVLILLIHVFVSISLESSKAIYIKQFMIYPLKSSVLLFRPLVYGLYLRRIRRLPWCIYTVFQ